MGRSRGTIATGETKFEVEDNEMFEAVGERSTWLESMASGYLAARLAAIASALTGSISVYISTQLGSDMFEENAETIPIGEVCRKSLMIPQCDDDRR